MLANFFTGNALVFFELLDYLEEFDVDLHKGDHFQNDYEAETSEKHSVERNRVIV